MGLVVVELLGYWLFDFWVLLVLLGARFVAGLSCSWLVGLLRCWATGLLGCQGCLTVLGSTSAAGS